MNIHVSEKHGVNPSIILCVWCGQPKAIALVGRLPNDAEAPREMIDGYEPCDKCLEQMKKGIAVFAVRDTPMSANQEPITDNPKPLYPTGGWSVVTEAGIRTICGDDLMMAAEVIKSGKLLVDQESYARIFSSEGGEEGAGEEETTTDQ